MKRRKILALFLTMAMALSLMACGGGEKPAEPEETVKEEAAEETTEEAAEETAPAAEEVPEVVEDTKSALATASWTNKAGEYIVDLVGAEKFIDEDGVDSLRVYYDFTNNTQYTDSFGYAVQDETYTQDGTELDYTYAVFGEDVPEFGNDLLNVRPGVTIRCVDEYALVSEGAVNVQLFGKDAESSTIEVLNYEFDLANLPGRPEEDLEIVPVADPATIKNWPLEGEYHGGFYVAIAATEFTEGRDGETVLRVYYELTNNSEEEDSPAYALYAIRAYQDNIQLNEGDAMSTVAEDSNYYEDVLPGETIIFTTCYELRTDSPVEVAVEDPWTDGGIGIIVPVE